MKLDGYQLVARECGTSFVAASPGVKPAIGGAQTKHPLADAVAIRLVLECKALSAEAKIVGTPERRFVYLAGCSFGASDTFRPVRERAVPIQNIPIRSDLGKKIRKILREQ